MSWRQAAKSCVGRPSSHLVVFPAVQSTREDPPCPHPIPFARILAALHRAALDDAHWPAASALIDEAVGVTGNSLTVSERVGDVVRVCFTGLYRRGERRQDLERAYFEDYYAHDERRPRLISAPDGQLLHAADLYNEKELKTSPAFNEGARLLGSQNGLNVRFDGPDGLHVLWCTADPVAKDGWQSTQLQLIEPLIPHIRHFVLVRQALAAADALGASLTGLLDNSRIGVLHLDRSGRLLAGQRPGPRTSCATATRCPTKAARSAPGCPPTTSGYNICWRAPCPGCRVSPPAAVP